MPLLRKKLRKKFTKKIYEKKFRGSFSQFFRRAGPKHIFKKFSGTPRSVYCLNLSSVRRLQLDKTPKNEMQKIDEKKSWIFGVDFCFQECKVLEELWIFNPRWQMRRKNSLPELPLFLGRVSWRRGKRPNMCRHLWLGTKNDLTLWCDHNMIKW